VPSVVLGCSWYRRSVSSRDIDTFVCGVVRHSNFRVWITLICVSSLVITLPNTSFSGKLDVEWIEIEGKAVSVRTMTAYKGSRGIAPLILNPCTYWTEGWVVFKIGVDFCNCPGSSPGSPSNYRLRYIGFLVPSTGEQLLSCAWYGSSRLMYQSYCSSPNVTVLL